MWSWLGGVKSLRLCLSESSPSLHRLEREPFWGRDSRSRSLLFTTSDLSHCSLLPSVSAERSAVTLLGGGPLYVICCSSLVAFDIFSLYLVFVSVISLCLWVSLWVSPVWDPLCFHNLSDVFLSQIREVFSYNLFKYFP